MSFAPDWSLRFGDMRCMWLVDQRVPPLSILRAHGPSAQAPNYRRLHVQGLSLRIVIFFEGMLVFPGVS